MADIDIAELRRLSHESVFVFTGLRGAELRELLDEIGRLRQRPSEDVWERAQGEIADLVIDVTARGESIAKLEAENERLKAALRENEAIDRADAVSKNFKACGCHWCDATRAALEGK